MNVVTKNIVFAAFFAIPVSCLAMEVNLTPGKFVEEVIRVNGSTDTDLKLTGQARSEEHTSELQSQR